MSNIYYNPDEFGLEVVAETNDRARIDRAQWKQLPRPARERETKTFRVESGCTIRIIHSSAASLLAEER